MFLLSTISALVLTTSKEMQEGKCYYTSIFQGSTSIVFPTPLQAKGSRIAKSRNALRGTTKKKKVLKYRKTKIEAITAINPP